MKTLPVTTISNEDADFARSKGFLPGSEAGYSNSNNLWINESGSTHVYETSGHNRWVRASFSPNSRIPFAHSNFNAFRLAIGS